MFMMAECNREVIEFYQDACQAVIAQNNSWLLTLLNSKATKLMIIHSFIYKYSQHVSWIFIVPISKSVRAVSLSSYLTKQFKLNSNVYLYEYSVKR